MALQAWCGLTIITYIGDVSNVARHYYLGCLILVDLIVAAKCAVLWILGLISRFYLMSILFLLIVPTTPRVMKPLNFDHVTHRLSCIVTEKQCRNSQFGKIQA